MKEYFDSSKRLSIELASSSSDDLFHHFASCLSKLFGAQISNQFDGVDQRYWDFKILETTVVLHSDTFIGISIHVEDGTNEDLLRKIAKEILKN